jgi:thiamine transport system permease protein
MKENMAEISLTGFNITKILDSLSSKPVIRYIVYSSSTIFFFALILIPPVLGILLKWNLMGQVFEDPNLTARATSAISASFLIAVFVSIVDVVAGLPMAWFIVRGKARWLSIIDTLADIPFIVPTVTLGYSLLLFWSGTEDISSPFGSSLVSPGWLLIIILHFTFSYPVVVRVIVGALQDYKYVYEEASRTLGAASLTAARTVTLSILKPSIIASFVLAFARSLSETGATVMVAGTFETGQVFIKNALDNGQQGPLVFVSLVLILVSAAIFAAIRILGPRLKMPIKRIWPNTERGLSNIGVMTARNSVAIVIFLFLVLIPSLFVAFPTVSAIASGTLSDALGSVGVWQGYWQSLGLSYLVAAVVTLLNVIVGLPMAVLIARKRVGKILPAILDILVNVPLIVPSIALGASMSIFWRNFAFIPEIGLLIFAHLSITYPYFVRAMAAAIERIDMDLENAARILGAKPFTVFKTIILPLTKYSLFAGAIMMFARSVDETGATLAVTTLKTAPVLLVDWVKHNVPATPLEIGLGCAFLIIFSFAVLLVLRFIVRGRGRY